MRDVAGCLFRRTLRVEREERSQVLWIQQFMPDEMSVLGPHRPCDVTLPLCTHHRWEMVKCHSGITSMRRGVPNGTLEAKLHRPICKHCRRKLRIT
jgi:hypothetical protein